MTELIRKSDALAACAPLYGWSIAAAEELEASIEALPVVTVGGDITGWVRRLRKTEEAGQAHHMSKADRLAIADFLSALIPTPFDASQAADPVVNAPDPAAIREAALREAADAVSRAAWRHIGDDSYSAGLEDGARRQNEADHDAILALIAKGAAE